jgi:tetratricopeptide (TPR) repeat protein
LSWLGCIYANVGRPSEAKLFTEKTIRIDPLNPVNYTLNAYIYIFEAQFNRALEGLHQAYKMDIKNPLSGLCYVQALAYANRLEEASSLSEKHLKENPNHLLTQLGQCLIYSLQGKKTEAMELMSSKVRDKARTDSHVAWVIATCDALIDEKEEALKSLECAVDLCFTPYAFLNEYDPFLENIRGEERFKKLMQRVKTETENFDV